MAAYSSHRRKRCAGTVFPARRTVSVTMCPEAPSGVGMGIVLPPVPKRSWTSSPGRGEKEADLEASKRACEPQVEQLLWGMRRSAEPVSKRTVLPRSSACEIGDFCHGLAFGATTGSSGHMASPVGHSQLLWRRTDRYGAVPLKRRRRVSWRFVADGMELTLTVYLEIRPVDPVYERDINTSRARPIGH